VTTGESVAEKNGTELALRAGWFLLICVTLYACYFSHLGAIGFLGPDEPRYASVAREMAESGDWITPRLYGKPWFEKPPLYYWGAALSFKLFGVSDTSARLPSALSALLATLALAWLAWRLYDAETARWLLLLLPTTVAMIGFAHAAATDMPFSCLLTVAMVFAANLSRVAPSNAARESSFSAAFASSALLNFVLFGLFLGLAVLAKGPAAIILCGGGIFFWALFTKRWHDAVRLFHPVAITAFAMTALPWYVLCARRNADFFRIFIIEHNFKRYLTPEFQHIQPFWFYVPVLLAALLPWTLLLFPATVELARSFPDRPGSGANSIFLATWSLFPVVFFSFSQSKLPGYILPAIPPLMLLCAGASSKLLEENSRFTRLAFSASSLVAIATIVTGFVYTVRLRGIYRLLNVAEVAPALLLASVLGFLACVVAAVFFVSRRPRTALITIVAGLVAFLLATPLARVDASLSARQTAQAIARIVRPDEDVLVCNMARSYVYGFNFYLHREVSELKPGEPKKPALVVIGSPACWSELAGRKYHMRTELDFARWPIIVVAAP
jgi:4-amino-4-deoxy-L-arabinose transferase-like glycosyltransferase